MLHSLAQQWQSWSSVIWRTSTVVVRTWWTVVELSREIHDTREIEICSTSIDLRTGVTAKQLQRTHRTIPERMRSTLTCICHYRTHFIAYILACLTGSVVSLWKHWWRHGDNTDTWSSRHGWNNWSGGKVTFEKSTAFENRIIIKCTTGCTLITRGRAT